MVLLSCLIAASLGQGGSTSALPTVDRWVEPALQTANVPDAVANWQGWKYQSASKGFPVLNTVDLDWSKVPEPVKSGPLAASAVPVQVHIVVVNELEQLVPVLVGTRPFEERFVTRFKDVEKRTLAESLYRASRLVTWESWNQLSPKFTYSSIDHLSVGDAASTGEPAPITELGGRLQAWVKSHTNVGSFVADDGQFRGPFNEVIFLLPQGYGTTPETFQFGSETVIIEPARPGLNSPGVLSASLAGIILNDVYGKSGVSTNQLRPLTTEPPRDPVDNTAAFKTGLTAANPPSPKPQSPANQKNFVQMSAVPAGVTESVVADPDRSSALSISWAGNSAFGNVSLPEVTSDQAKGGFKLHFWMKTTSPRPIVLSEQTPNGWLEFGLGDPGKLNLPFVPASHDGAWHEVSVPVSGTVLEIGTGHLASIPHEFDSVPFTAEFSDFEIQADSNAAAAVSAPQNSAQSIALQAVFNIDSGNAAGITALKETLSSPNDAVRSAALTMLAEHPVPSLEPEIIANLTAVSPRVEYLAAMALAKAKSPTAVDALRHQVSTGGFESSRVAVTSALGSLKDPANVSFLIPTAEFKTPEARITGIEAIVSSGGPQVQNLIGVWMQDPDPEVRLCAVKLSTPDENTAKLLIYYGVNDPSDSVRSAAMQKLLSSGNQKWEAEAIRGLNDDSYWVRLELLKSLTKSESSPALLKAIEANLNVNLPLVPASAKEALARLQGS